MRTMRCFAVVIGVTVFVSAQTASAPKSNRLADSVSHSGNVLLMDGHVKLAACGIIAAIKRSAVPTRTIPKSAATFTSD